MLHKIKPLVLVISLTLVAPISFAASFQGLQGSSFDSNIYAYGISADGTTVVGSAFFSGVGYRAMSWTSGGGMTNLGNLGGLGGYGLAKAVSADGATVAGNANSPLGAEAMRWTQAGGMVGLGDLPGGSVNGDARGISADGATVVGVGSTASSNEAFIWTQAGGMSGLGYLPGGIVSTADAVSADGTTVVGYSSSDLGSQAMRWTQADGMVGLGDLAGGGFSSHAFAISADGATVVGNGTSASGFEAMRWTQAGGMVGLGDLPGGDFSSAAFAVSADGGKVVGESNTGTGTGTQAFIWDASIGMISLSTLLIDQGMDLTGWDLYQATGISADGLTVVGNGVHNGNAEAWIATLNPFGSTISQYLTVTPPSNGSISSKDGVIACGTNCTGIYGINKKVTLTATSDADYKLTGWTGNCVGNKPTCTVTMDSAKTVGANFAPIQRTLKITKTGTGTGSVQSSDPSGVINCTTTCKTNLTINTPLTLVAYPDLNSVFTGWKGSACSGTGVCSLTMDLAKSVTATFTANYLLGVTTTGNGTVTGSKISCGTTCNATYTKTTTVTLKAKPKKGANFIGWSGACSGTATTCTVTMDATNANESVTATFNP